MRELRDLYSMAWHLAEAQRRLAVLAQVDADQLQTWSGLANSDRQVRLQRRRAALQQRVEQLREQFNAAAIGADTQPWPPWSRRPAGPTRTRPNAWLTPSMHSLSSANYCASTAACCCGRTMRIFPRSPGGPRGELEELELLTRRQRPRHPGRAASQCGPALTVLRRVSRR